MVLKYTQDDGSNRGTYGKIICTNFNISFLGEESALQDDEPEFYNKIIGENDITLQCVDQLYGGRLTTSCDYLVSTKQLISLGDPNLKFSFGATCLSFNL